LIKIPRRLLFFPLLLLALCAAGAEEWYFSNAAGMALEPVLSRLAALRNKYALTIAVVSPEDLPETLRPYHEASWRIEARTLFENGEESRRQWIFLDGQGRTRLAAAFNPPVVEDAVAEDAAAKDADAAAEAAVEITAPAGKAPVGFIEFYDAQNHITAEHQFSAEGDELIVRYIYNKGVLVRAETRRKVYDPSGEEMVQGLYTDYYRYSRSASLRAVERVYHEPAAADDAMVQLRFPHRILDSVAEKNFVGPGLAYSSEFFGDLFMDAGYRVLYTTDDRGRILTETRQDDEGKVIGELTNVWSANRLVSVTWKADGDDRCIEYEYDGGGDRIAERDYQKGILERTVRRENEREVEEIYMNGAVILRAVWENGRKISEDKVRSSAGSGGSGGRTP
jgi:hypothetical protein